MKKLMLALVAGSLSLAVAGAYAATGSPADSDKAGRMGPGTAAGQMGAVDPTPGKAGASTAPGMKGGASTAAGTSSGTSSSAAGSTGSGASATTGSSGAAATSGSGMDDSKAGRRARRASKG